MKTIAYGIKVYAKSGGRATIADYVFYKKTSLKTIDLPNCVSVGDNAFSGCNALTTLSLPKCISIGHAGFNTCSVLMTVDLPMVTSIGNGVFFGCDALATVSLLMVTSIGRHAFSGCSTLTALVLGGTNVCDLAAINAFGNCYHILGTTNSTYNPTGAKDGYIYVPDDLVDSYKSATNWTTYASQIKPLSEYAGVA